MFDFGINLRYWQSFAGVSTPASGHYIFRPDRNVYNSFKYSKITTVKVTQSSSTVRFTILFEDTETMESAFVEVDLNTQNDWFDVTVDLDEIPLSKKGKEVTLNVKLIDDDSELDLDNGGVFWTDSNGLAMQRRVLNMRPNYDLKTIAHQNISSNFYPVTSAIYLRDKSERYQMTVLVPWTHSGSVIEKGRIELMINRRLTSWDIYGIQQPLNETDLGGKGISVKASYRVNIFDRKDEVSK